ncbi:MAG: hypothetical protein ACJ77A_11090 [Actinomycetota bacterium]
MARRRNVLGIVLLVLDVAAWAVFAYFLVKTITTATSLTGCISDGCTATAKTAADYVPWVVGSAFAASMLLTGAILAFKMRSTGPSGPSSWDEVARMGAGAGADGWNQPATAGGPQWSPTVATTEFALPQAAPVAGGPRAAPSGGPQASIVATRTVTSLPGGGMVLDVDMDVSSPANQPPRRITKQLTLPPGGMARMYVGARIPVRMDPANPADVIVDVGS